MHAPPHSHPATTMGHAVTVTTTTTTANSNKNNKKLKCLVLGGASAGKTSILRRYFNGHFDSQRVPTLGSDFYTRRIPIPIPTLDGNNDNDNDDEKKMDSSPPTNNNVSMQVWDTPGRERFAANRNKNRKFKYTAAFSDSFFQNADAALLVYDITSSTSFTQLLNWHYDLQERIRRLQASGKRSRRPFPVLIVANKMDILQERADIFVDHHHHHYLQQVDQRDVMGLATTQFRGKDSRYEYRASPPSSSSSSSAVPITSEDRNRFEISTYMGTGGTLRYVF